MNGLPVTFTADTGASRTIVSTRVFKQIAPQVCPVIEKTDRLVGAGGAPIKDAGQARMDISLGPFHITKDIMVAEIEDDALLGYDILKGQNGKPADILLSRNTILLDNAEIPIFQIGKCGKTRRVVVADNMTVPGHTEAVVSVYIERFEADDDDNEADYLVEPTELFKERYPLQMATTLVYLNDAPTCKVRVLNPFPTEIMLRQDAEIGIAEKIERIVSVLTKAEHQAEGDNIVTVRRITTRSEEVRVVNEQVNTGKQVPAHLESLLQRSSEGKTEVEREALAKLLAQHGDTFSKDEWDLGLTHLGQHSINTGDAQPIKQRPRPVPLAYANEEKQAIEDLLKKGVIRKSTSPWASPIVLVRKKNGSIRPCVDYRRLNALVKPDGFPMPRVQECLDAVAGAKYFSSLDLTSGYFQIPLKEEDIPKSAFACKFGHYEMTRMAFGLNNSASTFQRVIELVLQGLQWETCLVYIDDIIVYAPDLKQHMERLEEVLSRIKEAGLKLKPDKCNLLQEEVVF